MTTRSLYETLERDLGLKLHHGTRSVEAGLASEVVADHLGIASGAPILILRGTTYLEDERPVEHFVGIHRGDRSCFEVDLYKPLVQDQRLGGFSIGELAPLPRAPRRAPGERGERPSSSRSTCATSTRGRRPRLRRSGQ